MRRFALPSGSRASQIMRLTMSLAAETGSVKLCFTDTACAVAGSLIKEHAVFEDSLMGSQHITNSEGIPEQSYHTALAATLDRLLLLGSQGKPAPQLHVLIRHMLCDCKLA